VFELNCLACLTRGEQIIKYALKERTCVEIGDTALHDTHTASCVAASTVHCVT